MRTRPRGCGKDRQRARELDRPARAAAGRGGAEEEVASLGVGIALFVVAAFFGVFALGFAFATIAAALATFLATWLALLIVTGGLLVLAGLLVVLGLRKLRKNTPLVPEQAIEEAKLTSEALRNGN